MSVVAAAIGGSAVIGYVAADKSGDAMKDSADAAANAQVTSNRESIAFQREMFDQQRADNAPWRDAGVRSLEKLEKGIADGSFDPKPFTFNFKADPGYQFRKQEGVNALDASAAARGRLQSGAQDRAVTRYGQDYASNEYDKAYSRARDEHALEANQKTTQFNQLASLSNVGQVANAADQSARTAMTTNVSQDTRATGNAIAQGYINSGNAQASAYQGQANALNTGAQNFLMWDAYKSGVKG